VQVCRGLQAAHGRGILHRDLKPENLFLTSDGFVKILDFGLAKLTRGEGSDTGAERTQTVAGVVMGTPGYLSPEQARGQEADARSDIFALGAILYEALSGKRAFAGATAADTISAILHEDPPPVRTGSGPLPGPVERVVRRCLAKQPEDRFHSAHDLALALEAALERPLAAAAELEEGEARSPYPGLTAFTEADAGRFFGREAEVAALWNKLRARKLLALIGPSGAGKTSFVRAGVVASRPEGWAAIVSTPGASPLRGLGRALAPELSGDGEALGKLVDIDDVAAAFDVVSRWRRGHAQVLVVVDQFEELFTLSAKETQERFTSFLGRLSSEADVHVLLSLRDDFLIRCSEHEPLAPVFESLTPLPGLTTDGLRRALVEPARTPGYRFEDEALVGEMVESVEGARGALPLLAFAVSRLCDTRDRERKLLTRAAYEEIGGVAGALAQHAEATLERIGTERQGMVREVFRTLATAHGTRAAAEREELLSLFPERKAAEEVLRELVDARLLTSYEVAGAEGQPSHHRVEIVHESLLKAWPRLVRWQALDEEGAVLRDQLRQAANLWEEKGRTSDLLWTGTTYREYQLWRERYPGPLTALEEDFARTMAERAKRRRRLRRLVASSVVAAALIVAAVTGMLWRRSEVSRRKAEAEALRAEAGKLLALARSEVDRYPTAALAYARKSLELADTLEARRFAVEVLWRGPVARILPVDQIGKQVGVPDKVAHFPVTALSPDGRWLATQSAGGHVLLFPADGGPPRSLPPPPEGSASVLGFSPNGDFLVAGGPAQSVRFLSLPDLRQIRRVELGGFHSRGWVSGGRLVTLTQASRNDEHPLVRTWPLAGGDPQTAGRPDWSGGWAFDVASGRIAYSRGRTLLLRRGDAFGTAPERIIGQLGADIADVAFVHGGDRLVSVDTSGEMRLWSGAGSSFRVLEGPIGQSRGLTVDREGWRLAVSGTHASADLWDLRDPPDAEPTRLRRPDPFYNLVAEFGSNGAWLATNNELAVAFWPLAGPWMRTLRRQGSLTMSVLAFSPDGRWLASCAGAEPTARARLWPLHPEDGVMRVLPPAQPCSGLRFHPDGKQVLVGTPGAGALLAPIAGGMARRLETGWEGAVQFTVALAFDASGRRAAASPFDMNPSIRDPKLRVLRVWDLPSGRARTFSLAHLTDAAWWGFEQLRFAPDGSVLAAGAGAGGVVRLVLPRGASGTVSSEPLYAAGGAGFDLSADGRQLFLFAGTKLLALDLVGHTSRRIDTHGRRTGTGAIDPSGRAIVTGDIDGVVRVGPITGGEPHLLLGGHTGVVWSVAVSPDGRWIASVDDEAIHLWPMPDVTKPPLHTLPHAELMAKLDALTNLRVLRDPTSSTGWKLDIGPFPGWKDVPTW
jgi:WD40 repeat protein